MTIADVRLATVNIASGRGGPAPAEPTDPGRDPTANPTAHPPADLTANSIDGLTAAFDELDADLVGVQELDSGQPRSGGIDQPALLATATRALDWRSAATLTGTPGPRRDWRAEDPPRSRGPHDPPPAGPGYGIAVYSRRTVRRWHVLALPAGRAALPVRVTHPHTGRTGVLWVPDEPRAAVAAELDGLTVIGTHLSFSPWTAVRQLRAVRTWAAGLPGPVVLLGDLNLPGTVPALLTGGTRLVTALSYPATRPRVQLDHLIALHACRALDPTVRRLPVGDHLAMAATIVTPPIVTNR